MDITKVTAVYFSPNGSTKKIVNKIANGFTNLKIEEKDLVSFNISKEEVEFKKDELVIIGFPVYGDRLPAISKEIFKKIKGNNTPTVAIVSYGNRDYGDALLELTDKLKEINMKVISGAAVIGEHCLNTNIATNRPDKEDNKKLLNYALKLQDQIESIKDIENLADISMPGNDPYAPLKPQRTPLGDSKCIQCGLCESRCPVNAIDKENFRKTDSDICVFCGHCIQVCPVGARDIKDEDFQGFMQKLESMTKERKELEVYLN